MPKAVADAGLQAARDSKADGLVAVGGGSAIGLAKAIALQTALPIIAVPTTYSGSETTTIYGVTEAARKVTGRDVKVLPRTIIYDPDLTLGLPAAVSAASGMNAIAHCVESFWADGRTPVTLALASESMRRFAKNLPAVVADGSDREARVGMPHRRMACRHVLSVSNGLQHKLAHVLGGLGLPHAEAHAIILPHVTRFNLAAAPEAKTRLQEALGSDDPADGDRGDAGEISDPASAARYRLRFRKDRFRRRRDCRACDRHAAAGDARTTCALCLASGLSNSKSWRRDRFSGSRSSAWSRCG